MKKLLLTVFSLLAFLVGTTVLGSTVAEASISCSKVDSTTLKKDLKNTYDTVATHAVKAGKAAAKEAKKVGKTAATTAKKVGHTVASESKRLADSTAVKTKKAKEAIKETFKKEKQKLSEEE